MNKRTDVNYNFQRALKGIKNGFDLELPLLEQRELKKIVDLTTKVYLTYSDADSRALIDPGFEALFRFMNKNYGTKIRHQGDLQKIERASRICGRTLGFDNTLDKYKLIQEETYFP